MAFSIKPIGCEFGCENASLPNPPNLIQDDPKRVIARGDPFSIGWRR